MSYEAAASPLKPAGSAKLIPLEVTVGDSILLPVSIVNATDTLLKDAALNLSVPPGLEAEVDEWLNIRIHVGSGA